MANSGVLASSRFPFAMAQSKLLPELFNKIHPKYLTPVTTIVSTCILMTIVILFLDVEKIAKLASAFKVTMFMLVNLCVIILRETAPQWYKPTFRAPFYPYVQIFGILSGLTLLFFFGWLPILSILIMIAVGVLIYYSYGNRKTIRSGVLKRYGHRPALYLLYNKKRNPVFEPTPNVEQAIPILEDETIAPEAGVVVPLLGNEKSPEMLVEIAAAIHTDGLVQTVHITEVPDQTNLDALMDENPLVQSLSRRMKAVAHARQSNIEFESVVTHNVSDTIHALSDQTHCNWMVMGWNGRARSGIIINNPIGWLVTHINSNFALFKDNGVRHISKVLLAIRPLQTNTQFVQVAERISQSYGTTFTLLHIIPTDTFCRGRKACRKSGDGSAKSLYYKK